ncbi:MAG: UDP-N-acetylglucosamine--N-acetylmuramyl-(pentapeptide) pyrophosphoryl-undecaprenol N-acetylglucosamine transferase, partial [Caulobacterales bacterium]
AMSIWRGVQEAKARMVELRPVLIAGFGGYPSLPALAAAGKRPVLIHEQNSVLGRVNKMFAGRAAIVACGFDRLDGLPRKYLKRKRVTGNPVRPPIRALRNIPYPPIHPGGDIQLLITGGSQGARILGDVVPAACARLPDDLRMRLKVVQQTRQEQIEAVQGVYAKAGITAECAPFFSDMADRLAASHFFVGRAGASTLTELTCVGRPALFVPLGIAMDDHQTANAAGMVAAGAADALGERDFTPDKVAALLTQRLNDPAGLSARARSAHALGKPDAADALAAIAEQLVDSNEVKS